MLALIGLVIALLLFAGAALPVLLSRDADTDETSDDVAVEETPTDAGTDDGGTEDAGTDDAAIDDAGTNDAGTDDATTTTVAPTTTTSTTTTTTTTTTLPPVPESKATVRGGQIFLEGAVPTEEARAEIVALATEIFGPDNVIDGYFIDPRAGDPNLGNVQVSDAVLFESGSAVISPAFEPLLNQGFALLQIRPAATFVFEGHTDSLGSDEENLLLSQRRADAVVRWYTDRGVDPSRLSAFGRGETEPIASDDTAEGRQMNRRLEVTIENLLGEAP